MLAGIFWRGNAVFVHGYDSSDIGHLASAPFIALFEPTGIEVGNAIIDSLQRAKEDVDLPSEWNLLDPLYELAGVRDEKEFYTEFQYLEIDCEQGLIRIQEFIRVEPQKSETGEEMGFRPTVLHDALVEIDAVDSASIIGEEVLRLLYRDK